MFFVLAHRVYRRLLAAQVVALLGTGLMTVALGLLAYDLAGDSAGTVLGTALTIKMLAYVGLAPVASAITARLPRKSVLIAADLVRAAVALLLPFVDAVWQVYLLIFLLQAASATFTPAFQAAIPEILPDEDDYTAALTLSRLAYDIENLVSPVLAGLLLLVVGFSTLFAGTMLGFLASAALVASGHLPVASGAKQRPFRERVTRGIRIYLATPRLRGLLALNMSAAAISAFVLVNTVVLVRGGFGKGETALALALAAYGGGSMLAALGLPRILRTINDRPVMLSAGLAIGVLSLLLGFAWSIGGLSDWRSYLLAMTALGVLYSAILTPSGRLLRRSAHAEDRPAVFAAQFALSHGCWLFTYPAAGWLGPLIGVPQTLALLGALALISAGMATRFWQAGGQDALPHEHPDLPDDHPHLQAHRGEGHRHSHVYVIDDEHRVWPTYG